MQFTSIYIFVNCLIFNFSFGLKFSKLTFARTTTSIHSTTKVDSLQDKDKLEVENYFNNEGFSRWNKIYSESDEINAVQLDIRNGHAVTVSKVLNWVENENNEKNTICDAGCGVGSLALPLASKFKRVFASDISAAMTNEAKNRADSVKLKNIEFKVSDMEKLNGKYNTVTCIDVMIHYPSDKIEDIIGKLGSLATDRLIISFAPKNIFYEALKKNW